MHDAARETPVSAQATERVPFLDLRVENPAEREAYLQAIDRILQHGQIVNGPEVTALEEAVARYCGTQFAVGVSSGTAAIYLGLRCLGIGSGDEVIVPALSFIGTANAVLLTGAVPVFVDIRRDLQIDPGLIEPAVTPRTKAVMPVHFAGMMGAMAEIEAIVKRRGLAIVEDAAPAFGAMCDGRMAGSYGPVGCISMNPMKVLNACGEAGIVLVQEETLRDRLRELRYHGMVDKEYCRMPSFNGRLDTIQAAILLHRLGDIERTIARRRTIADAYGRALARFCEAPREAEGRRNVYYTYTILTDARDALRDFLERRGIEVRMYHKTLMPEHPALADRNWGEFPVGRSVTAQILCLPMHEKLDDGQVGRVIDAVIAFFSGR